MGATQQMLLAKGGSGATNYLDQLATTPRGAWGLRKMISTATQCIRVRRSSDNTEQDIGFSGDLLDTAALATFVGGGNGFVVTMYNQVASAPLAYINQSSTTAQARIVNAGVYDGKLVFDSTDGYGSNGAGSITMGTAHAYVVANWEATVDGSVRVLLESSANYSANNNRFAIYTYSVQGSMLGAMGTGTRINSFPNGSGLTVWSYHFDKTQTGTDEIRAWKSGTLQTATPVASTDISGTFDTEIIYLGARSGSGSLFSSMRFKAMAIYNADISAIRSTVETIVGGA